MKRPPLRRLFHLTEASNLEAIRTHGLLSTAALLDRDAPPPELRARVDGWRPEAVRLPSGVLIAISSVSRPSGWRSACRAG